MKKFYALIIFVLVFTMLSSCANLETTDTGTNETTSSSPKSTTTSETKEITTSGTAGNEMIEWNLDVTSDKIAERIVVNTVAAALGSTEENTVSVYSGDTLIWSDSFCFGAVHKGGINIVVPDNGSNDSHSILVWKTLEANGKLSIMYEVFRLQNDGEKFYVQRGSKVFNVENNVAYESLQEHITKITSELNSYLVKSFILLDNMGDELIYSYENNRVTPAKYSYNVAYPS